MNKNAIANALKARAAQRGQARGNAAAPTGLGPSFGQGGVMQQYNEWNFGISYGGALPRSWEDFQSGAFGPLTPLQPMQIDRPGPESDRAEPRRMQYPVGWNMPMGQPGSEGLKLVSFANLRAYADMYSVVRACIQVRKEEILGLDWDIVPTDEAARDMRGDTSAHDDFQDRRKKAIKFFKRPDPNYHDFSGWMSAVLEDVFVVDALSLYLHPSRISGKGLFGSDLAALEILDGTTIRPLLDIRGGTPRPPAPGYQQYLWGVPRTDLMDIILEADIEEMDDPVDEYRSDQLLYLPYTRRSWTPYGFPGIERAIIPVMTGLRRQQYQLEFFSEGTIPGQFIIPGDDISTPQQIRQLQDTLNAIAGDQAWKHKIIVLPRGSDAKPQKPIELAGQIDEILLNEICMAYDVMPMELGMSPSVSSSQSSGAANQMAQASSEINQRKALKPMLQWLKNSIFDHILQDICGQEDMQFMWVGLEDSMDEEAKANNFKTLISTGLLSIDEARAQMGLSPWGLPLTSDPVYASATGISTLGTIDPTVVDASLGSPIADPNSLATQPTAPQAAQLGGQQPPTSSSIPTPNPAAIAAPTSAGPQAAAGTPGIGGRPRGGGGGAPAIIAPAAGTSTPLHGSKEKKAAEKVAMSEMESLRRFLKKGKSIDKWTPEFIDEFAFSAVKKAISQGKDAGAAIAIGKQKMRIGLKVAQRKRVVSGIAAHVANELNNLAANIHKPEVGMIGFIDHGTRILQHGYHAVYNGAARDAASTHPNVSRVVPGGFLPLAQQRAEKQRDYLTGFAQDIISGASQPKIQQRFNLYARTLHPAYEQGFGLAVLSGQALGNSTNPALNDYVDPLAASDTPDVMSPEQWDTTDAAIADGTFDTSTVDDYSALDSMYNDTTSADYVDQVDTGYSDGISALDVFAGLAGIGAIAALLGGDQTDENGVLLGDSPDGFDSQPNSVIVWNTTGDNPCELCAERDGEEYTLETLPCWPGDGMFDEFCEGAANCNCTLDYVDGSGDVVDTADNPFKDFSNDFYQQRAAEEAAYDQAAADARAADIAAVAETSPEAAARMQARDMLYGIPNTRGGYFGSAKSNLEKDAKMTDVVYRYLKEHYKKNVVKWAKDASWSFEPEISLSKLTLMRSPANVDQARVDDIKEDITNGKAIHPIVVVKTSNGLEVADGNHRVTAMRELGMTNTTAYVGTGVGDNGPWDDEMQNNKMKKSIEPAVQKIDTSNYVYKSLDADTLQLIEVGDVLTDDGVVLFTNERPVAGPYVVVKYLPTGRLLPNQQLSVVSIDGEEVTLEVL